MMIRDRVRRLQDELKKRQIDCLALIPGANLYYMTGLEFHLMERAVTAFSPAEGPVVFALPGLESAKAQTLDLPGLQAFCYQDGEEPARAYGPAISALPEIHTLAVEYLRMRVHELRLIQRHAPNATLSDAGPIMDTLRLTKSADEIARMRKAVAISEKSLEETIAGFKVGMTERQFANALNIQQLKNGGGVLPFDSIVLAGPKAALPHGSPDDTPIKAGEVLLVDYGTSCEGYISDITRTFMVGGPPGEKFRAVYEAVKAGNAAGRAAAGPGVPCQEVDRAARKAITEAGFGEYFIHRTGHGIGLEGHEGPYMVKGNDLRLEVGMTFTVEPGVYIPWRSSAARSFSATGRSTWARSAPPK